MTTNSFEENFVEKFSKKKKSIRLKTARRFVNRNKYKWLLRIYSPSFGKRYETCLKIVEDYYKKIKKGQ